MNLFQLYNFDTYNDSNVYSDHCTNFSISSSDNLRDVHDLDGSGEFVQEKVKSISVKGRLERALEYWKSFCSDQFILNTIEFGYKLPFREIPPPSETFRNNRSALNNSKFVVEAITQLLDSGCVRPVNFKPRVVNPLSVAEQSSGKKRLILDLRKVNLFLVKFKFKMEDLRNIKDVLSEGDYMFKYDLKFGYHHVDIFIEHQEYLGFSWCFDGVTKFLYLLFYHLVCRPLLICLQNC